MGMIGCLRIKCVTTSKLLRTGPGTKYLPKKKFAITMTQLLGLSLQICFLGAKIWLLKPALCQDRIWTVFSPDFMPSMRLTGAVEPTSLMASSCSRLCPPRQLQARWKKNKSHLCSAGFNFPYILSRALSHCQTTLLHITLFCPWHYSSSQNALSRSPSWTHEQLCCSFLHSL